MTRPKDQFQVTPLRELKLDSVNSLVRELEVVHRNMEKALAEVKGIGGNKPAFGNDVDMEGHDMENIGTLKFKKPITSSTKAKNFIGGYSGGTVTDFATTQTALDEIGSVLGEVVRALKQVGIIA